MQRQKHTSSAGAPQPDPHSSEIIRQLELFPVEVLEAALLALRLREAEAVK